MRGHNEKSFRLDELAQQARRGLDRVTAAEADAIEGWLTYGAALNEGRTLFPSDEQFGQWMDDNRLRQLVGHEVNDHERAAAMWAAANLDQFEEARDAGNARTMRGIHAKWKEIEAERAAEEAKAEAQAKAEEPATPPSPGDSGRQEDGCEIPPPADPDPVRKSPDTSGADKAGTSVADATDGPAPDPYGYAKLTEEALLDLANGLREALDEEKAKRKKAEAERDDYKAKWQEALAQDDMGRALGNAQRQRDTAKGRLDEELAKNARQGRRITILEAELKKLREQVEGQEFTL